MVYCWTNFRKHRTMPGLLRLLLLFRQADRRVHWPIRVISKVEIFQMNVVFGTAYGFKKVIEFFTPAGKQFYFVAVSDGNADSWRKLITICSLDSSAVSCRCTHKLSVSPAFALPIVKSNNMKNICSFKALCLYLVHLRNKDTTSLFGATFCQGYIYYNLTCEPSCDSIWCKVSGD